MLFFFQQRKANKTSDGKCKMPSCNLRSHSALGNAAMGHGKAILEEVQEELLTVYIAVKSTKKHICPWISFVMILIEDLSFKTDPWPN